MPNFIERRIAATQKAAVNITLGYEKLSLNADLP
jgi:hypothetical protein